MKIEQITEQYVDEAPGAGGKVYIGLNDEAYEGMHPIERWVATSDINYAKQQATELAADNSDDIAVVVLVFVDGVKGVKEVARDEGGIDISAEVAKHNNDDDDYPMSDNVAQLSKQGR